MGQSRRRGSRCRRVWVCVSGTADRGHAGARCRCHGGDRGGRWRSATSGRGGSPFAALLGRVIAQAPVAASVSELSPSPPWTAGDHPGRRLWPDRNEHGQDLNLLGGPDWAEQAARRVRNGSPLPRGRCASVMVTGRRRTFDGSVMNLSSCMTGTASSHHPRRRSWDWPLPCGPASRARTRPGDSRCLGRRAVGSTMYVKQEAAEGGGEQLHRLSAEIDERLDHAGVG